MARLVLILLALIGSWSTTPARAEAPVVRTTGGDIRGTEENGLIVYRGIPYAAPPVGNLRWRPPQPASAWQGVREADAFGPTCPQPPVPWMPPEPGETFSEDCLYLNVWTSARATASPRPVMVWIHGGAYSNGSGRTPLYHGTTLVPRGVVLVTINYRLGPLGFLAHPALTAESPDRTSGNYAVMDQIAALRWVRDNIAAFGGHPGNVTIFGESAGGGSVMLLTISPPARGLFHKAIMESGAALPPLPRGYARPNTPTSLRQAERSGLAYAASLGAADLAALRAIPAEHMVRAPNYSVGWPFADGRIVPGDVTALYRAGRQHDVPVLLGWNSHEGDMFVRPESRADYETAVRRDYGPVADRMLALYPAHDDPAQAFRSAARLFGDVAFAWPSWTLAAAQARAGRASVYLYHFTQVPPRPPHSPFQVNGAAHADEMQYVFGAANPAWTDGDRAVSELMQTYWVNFARTGDPNGGAAPAWPRFDGGATVQWLGEGRARTGPVPTRERLEALDQLIGN